MAPILKNSLDLTFQPYIQGQNLVTYSKKLGEWLHKDEFRQNGLSYFEDHSEPIAQRIEQMRFHPQFAPVFIGVAYLHDVIENNLGIKIFSPYGRFANRTDKSTLNILFPKAQKPERQLLYCVNRITDTYPDKFAYMSALLKIKPSEMFKILDIGTLIVKTVDIWANNRKPTEQYAKANDSTEEQGKADAFLAKKLRNLLHMKYKFIPQIEEILLKGSKIKINGQPLYNQKGIEILLADIEQSMNEFIKINPPMQVIMANQGLGEPSIPHIKFYAQAFQKLSSDAKKAFNYFHPKPLPHYMQQQATM